MNTIEAIILNGKLFDLIFEPVCGSDGKGCHFVIPSVVHNLKVNLQAQLERLLYKYHWATPTEKEARGADGRVKTYWSLPFDQGEPWLRSIAAKKHLARSQVHIESALKNLIPATLAYCATRRQDAAPRDPQMKPETIPDEPTPEPEIQDEPDLEPDQESPEEPISAEVGTWTSGVGTTEVLTTENFAIPMEQIMDDQGRKGFLPRKTCEGIGADWETQRQRIWRTPELCAWKIQVRDSSGRLQEQVVIPWENGGMFIYGINAKHVSEEIRPNWTKIQAGLTEAMQKWLERGPIPQDEKPVTLKHPAAEHATKPTSSFGDDLQKEGMIIGALVELHHNHIAHAQKLHDCQRAISRLTERFDELAPSSDQLQPTWNQFGQVPYSQTEPNPKSIRKQINEVANNFCRATGISQEDVYREVYKELYYRDGKSVKSRWDRDVRMAEEDPAYRRKYKYKLDVVEELNLLEEFHAIITKICKPKETG